MTPAKKVEFNEKFIAEWEKEECLWNTRQNLYKDRNARQNALKRIAELFGMSGK